MKSLIILFFILTLSIEMPAQMNKYDFGKSIEQVRQKFAPDKRTAVFNIVHEAKNNEVILIGETNLPEAKAELISNFKGLKIVDNISLLPSKDLGDKIFGVVNLSVSNVRTKPEHSAELATQVPLGSRLKILKAAGEWFLVQCEDDYIGWIDDDGFYSMNKAEFDEWNNSVKIIVTVPFTFAYSEKNILSVPVSDVVEGNLLRLVSQENDFVKIKFPDGREAFLSTSETQNYNKWLSTRVQSFEAIRNSAFSKMGLPYVWGGTSFKGVDCSGFTKIVFKSCALELPRDASQQVYVGELIDTHDGFENLEQGDLLFFGRIDSVSGKEKITHVAIYLGNLEFIHASGRVRINSFDKNKSNFAADRLKTFIKAKRILTSIGKNGVKLTQDLNEN